MKNRIVGPKTAEDIDGRVERVLRGLGRPEPPLRLEDVRELLRLDRGFYVADDPGLLQEVISRIRVAGIQVWNRPALLAEAIDKWSLKALYLPDRNRILLDSALPPLKHRWNEAHEIGHSILPWHQDAMLGDNVLTLTPDCHDQVEAEANFAAGRLLFLRDLFVGEARSVPISIESVRRLHRRYGNTLSTTLYRFVEAAEVPVVGMISEHPHPLRRGGSFDPASPCRHFIRSPVFARQFSDTFDVNLFAAVSRYCGAQKGGPLGEGEITLVDDGGARHRFHFETFFNRYDALTLGRRVRPAPLVLAVAG